MKRPAQQDGGGESSPLGAAGPGTVLVLGGRSYIGARLTEHLKTEGVAVQAVTSSDCDLLVGAQVRRLLAAHRGRRTSIVFLAVLNKWREDSYSSFCRNVEMAHNVAVAVKEAGDIASLVYLSTADVYGNGPALPVTEDSSVNPDSWYALSKSVGEWILMSSGELACPVTVLRIPGIYGKAPNERSVVGGMAQAVLGRQPIVLRKMGQVLRDYVWVDDLCRLIGAFLSRPQHGVVNVATGHSLRTAEIVRQIGAALGMDPVVQLSPEESVRDFDLAFDIMRLIDLVPAFRFSSLDGAIRPYLVPQRAGEEPCGCVRECQPYRG